MFRSRIFLLTGILALLVAACAPAVTTPTPIMTEEPAPIISLATVQSVEIQVLEGSPLRANAIIRGQLPDGGCTTISGVEQARDGNVIRIRLITTTDPVALCTLAITPFEHVVPLEVADLAAAEYLVTVNGIEKSFELLPRDAVQFSQLLVESLNARNYDLLRVLMHDSLVIAHWQSEGSAYTPEQAVEQLRSSLISSSATVSADPNKDLAALLGMDPITILGPDVVEARPLWISGVGPEGRDQSILFVARLPDGSLYWHGLLFAKDGFGQTIPVTGPQQPVATPQATPQPVKIPTITILAVVRDEQVTIRAQDYPADVDFKVRMGRMGSGGVDGIVIDTLNSGRGGSFTVTIDIPEKLQGEKQIAIRLESTQGYYSYNWFDNATSGNTPKPTDPQPTSVEYVVARQDVSIYSGPSKNFSVIGSVREGRSLKVTAVTMDGNWWRVVCPDGSNGNCWVSAKPKFTRPSA